jgi:hypothetical protein
MPRGVYERNNIAQDPATPEITAGTEAATEVAQALSPRAQDTRRERRRRDDGDLDRMGRMALAIPPEVKERLDREGKTARWVRDAPGRQHSMHRDDWDITPGVDPVPEGKESEGKLVLMEKFKDWYDSDQRKKAEVLDEREKALIRGESPENRRPDDNLVVPKGQVNRISREPGV